MEFGLQVEIISTKLIKPSTPTPKHLQNYKLSFFDQLAEREHMPHVLFYPRDNKSIIEYDKFDEKLEQSLSRILTHVYPAAGRLSKDQLSINCLDQGVTFTKAKVSCQFDDFINQVKKDLNLALFLIPKGIKDLSDTDFDITSLVVAQVTEFQCGGLALSVSASHPVMDGYSNFKFVYEWAKVCKFGIPAEEINFLSFNFGDIFPARDLSSIFPPRIYPKNSDEKFVGKRFFIDEITMSGLRENLTSAMDSGELSFKPSRVEIITAILWRALIRVSEVKHGYLRPSLVYFPVNLRGKISLPLKENAFGNFVIDAPILFVPRENKMELHDFVTLIRNSVHKTIAACAKNSADDIVVAVANSYKDYFLSQKWGTGNDEVDKCIISSLCKFPIHEADFGWGKPSLMHFGLRDYHTCWMYDTECGSICVQVDLKESYMHLFECDHDIKTFTKF
ncbi:epi-neemfruitin B synthase L1AT-like [Nicotiana tabacum]|uniref:Acetyl-CoA-benzylalcohol acetyltransferase-like n=1 Tax=Nicotiana tabacum TaxID=4097 RepID=A0A1S3YS51_TOBAC|nr:PREDICTED: acetyl-CoA-benzylalcohol acetyltransferase-like [Nicotiana tabacum]